jgi:hypothetical protein
MTMQTLTESAVAGYCSAQLRPLVIPNGGIVRPECKNELKFLARDLLVGRSFRVPENLLSDREVAALCRREIAGDEIGTGATEVVDAVRQVLTDIDLAVRVRDFVYDSAANFRGAWHWLKRYAVGTVLAIRTTALKHIRAVSAIDMTTARHQTYHSIGPLSVISSRNATVTSASLVVAIDRTDACGVGSTTFKLLIWLVHVNLWRGQSRVADADLAV